MNRSVRLNGSAMSAAETASLGMEDLPGPRRLPLIGNAHQMRRPMSVHRTIEEWCERYGPIFRFDLGPRRFVAIGDVDVINEILRDRPDGFRRASEILTQAKESLGAFGVFHAEGADWRHQRRLVVTALNSNHLHRYFQVVATSTERLYRRLDAAARREDCFDVGELFASFTVDVTSALAFGHDLNTLERGEGEIQAHVQRAFEGLNRRLLTPLPYWRWFKLPADRALDRSVAVVREAVMEFVERARQRIAERPELRESPENLLESMIAAQEKDGTYSDDEIFGNVFTILLAGEDTTSHSMAWTTWLLARHPQIQARWAEEARAVLGEECFPASYETVDELRYGEAVLRESMRLKSVVPLIGLETLADTKVAGVLIPAGTKVSLLTRYAGLHDSGVERSLEFDPQRWLDEDGSAPDQKGFAAFGAGPRFCPGRNLAFLEAKAAMGMFARNFEVELDPAAPPVAERIGLTMSPVGLRVRLRRRSPSTGGRSAAATAPGGR